MRSICGALLALATLLIADSAAAQERFALLVGNSDYNLDRVVDASETGAKKSAADGFVPDLRNPANDVADVGAALQRAGYQVRILPNATLVQMREGVEWLAQSARAAGPEATAVFYFAGHGVNVSASDYLVPAGARMPELPPPAGATAPEGASAEEVLRAGIAARMGTPDAGRDRVLRTEFFAVRELLAALPDPGMPWQVDGVPIGPPPQASPKRVYFFDSCRNNAFFDNGDMENFFAKRSLLGLMGFMPSAVFIFSATPPQVALDGAGRNSVFARAVRQQIARPSRTVVQMFEAVKRDVVAASNGTQQPDALANNPDLDRICLVSCPPAPPAEQKK